MSNEELNAMIMKAEDNYENLKDRVHEQFEEIERLNFDKEQLNSLVNSCQKEIRRLKEELKQAKEIALNEHKYASEMEDKYIILLKFYNRYWRPYFKDTGWTDTNPSKFHCFDYEYAKQLYDKVCKNFSTSQWMLVKLEELHNAPLDEFKYIKGE